MTWTLPASLRCLRLACQRREIVTGRNTNGSRQAIGRRAQEASQGPRAGQGVLRPQEHALPLREGAGRALARLRVPRPSEQEADAPVAVDRADQRGGPRERALVQPVHERRAQGRDRARPEVARRPRGRRPRGVRGRRRAGEGCAGRRGEGRVTPDRAPQVTSCNLRPVITSRDNATLTLVRKLLRARKHREETGWFAAEGEDLVEAAAEAGLQPVHLLVAGETVDEPLLARVSTLPHPAGAIGVYRSADLPAGARERCLALWRLSDPGNVGTLLRTADAFGAAVALSEGCADPLSPKALRASAGAIFRVPLVAWEQQPGARIALVAHGGS